MTAWRCVKSLLHLIGQSNAAWPDRSTASDGTIGDAAHAARQSDHNPHFVPALGPVPVVTAADITHDPAHGCDSYALADALLASRDRRIKYLISNRRIGGPHTGWAWTPYDGSDPHTNHMHVSVLDAAVADDEADWQIGAGMDADLKLALDTLTRRQSDQFKQLEGTAPHADGRTYGLEQLTATLAAIGAKLDEVGTPAPVALSDTDRAAIADAVTDAVGAVLATLVGKVDALEAKLAKAAADVAADLQ